MLRIFDIYFLAGYYKGLYYYNSGRMSFDLFFGIYGFMSMLLVFAMSIFFLSVWAGVLSDHILGYNLYLSCRDHLAKYKYIHVYTVILVSIGPWYRYMYKRKYVELVKKNKSDLSRSNTKANIYAVLLFVICCVAIFLTEPALSKLPDQICGQDILLPS